MSGGAPFVHSKRGGATLAGRALLLEARLRRPEAGCGEARTAWGSLESESSLSLRTGAEEPWAAAGETD